MRTFVFISVFVLTQCAVADTVYFQPDGAAGKDAYTEESFLNDNFGGLDYLFCAHVEGLDAWAVFIEFDGLDDSQYQGVEVASATLSMWVYDYHTGGQFQLGVCSSSWDEFAVTWNNRPSYYASVFADYPTAPGFMQFDVTDWVQNWLDGTWVNNGLSCFDNTGTYETVSFYSSDYSNSALHPILALEYTPNSLDQLTWGSVKTTLN